VSTRFAVSTLGMPGRPLHESAVLAAGNGCHGLEIRTHPDEQVNLSAPPARLRALQRVVADAGLEIPCLAGYVRVCADVPDADVGSELSRLVAAAHEMGAEAIRVFPGGEPADTARGCGRIEAALPELEAAGVRLLVETHDSHPSVRAAAGLVAPLGRPDLAGLLWDAVHPWMAGEPPAASRKLAGEYLAYFQIKDLHRSPAGGGRPVPAVPGDGDLPLDEFAAALAGWDEERKRQNTWVSLEWELAWHPGIGPVDRALAAARDWYSRLVP